MIRVIKITFKILLAIAVFITMILYISSYDDWSDVNEFVHEKCKNNNHQPCPINFRGLHDTWDELFYFTGAEQLGVDLLLKGKKSVKVSTTCEYLAFFDKNELVHLHEQCHDPFRETWDNSYDKVLIMIDIDINSGQPINVICDSFIASESKNYYRKNSSKSHYIITCSG